MGSVTWNNLRLSVVAGTAFVDFGAANTLTPYLDRKLILADSAGKKLTGYIKAAGTGETYGSENISNGGFDSDSIWSKQSDWTISGGVANCAGLTADQWIYQATTLINGGAYRFSFDIKSVSSGAVVLMFHGVASGGSYNTTGIKTPYRTEPDGIAASSGFFESTLFNGSLDDVSCKQVLTPSITGVTIVNAQGGSTYNWESEESGFNRNDANGYTYTISTGAKYPTAAETVSESPWLDNTWENPANIYGAGNAAVTAATFDAGDQSYVLKAYGFDFSSIPDGSTIDGVICRVGGAYYATAICALDLAQLLNTSRAKVGTNQYSTNVDLTTSPANYDKGSSTDLWGNALTAAWVKNSNFGVGIGIKVGASNNCDVYVDLITLEIYYTPPATQYVPSKMHSYFTRRN